MAAGVPLKRPVATAPGLLLAMFGTSLILENAPPIKPTSRLSPGNLTPAEAGYALRGSGIFNPGSSTGVMKGSIDLVRRVFDGSPGTAKLVGRSDRVLKSQTTAQSLRRIPNPMLKFDPIRDR